MGPKILVVDDEPFIVKLIESRLKANGYQVVTATNGVDGVHKAIEHLPNLIILDIMMPQMDGSAMAENLHQNPKTSEIPILFLTSLVQKSETSNNTKIGGNYFIAKPFDPQQLLSTIKMILENKPAKLNN